MCVLVGQGALYHEGDDLHVLERVRVVVCVIYVVVLSLAVCVAMVSLAYVDFFVMISILLVHADPCAGGRRSRGRAGRGRRSGRGGRRSLYYSY